MSTIKVDTIQKANGTSQIGIDKIGGVTSASIVNVIAEGGSTTTNLAQGLAKAWCKINGTGTPAINDSFNCGSITDNGTGDYSTAITSAFSNVSNIVAIGMEFENSTSCAIAIGSSSTSSMRLKSFDEGNASDREHLGFLVHGDLA